MSISWILVCGSSVHFFVLKITLFSWKACLWAFNTSTKLDATILLVFQRIGKTYTQGALKWQQDYKRSQGKDDRYSPNINRMK